MWIQLPEFGQMLSSSVSGISTTARLLLQRPGNGPVALLLSPPPKAVTAPGPAGTGTQQGHGHSRDTAVRCQRDTKGPTMSHHQEGGSLLQPDQPFDAGSGRKE